jgi:hypothetical protein
MLDKIVSIAIGATVFFLLVATIVLPQFNTSYNYTVTGLSASTLQGLLLLVLVMALIGVATRFIKSGKKGM